jgi:hypothetical protein
MVRSVASVDTAAAMIEHYGRTAAIEAIGEYQAKQDR